jgi:hypothetical protein
LEGKFGNGSVVGVVSWSGFIRLYHYNRSLRYYDKTKPVEEYCRVCFARNWQILTFDGDNVAKQFLAVITMLL